MPTTVEDEAPAKIGHNSVPALIQIEEDPGLVYRDPDILDAALRELDEELAKFVPDDTTTAGRKEIASFAASFSRRKARILEAGLALTAGWRASTDKVNALKSRAEREFDARRNKARKPLDDWEAAKKVRDDNAAEIIKRLDEAGIIRATATTVSIGAELAWVEKLEITEQEFGDLDTRAKAAQMRAVETMKEALVRLAEVERERQELAKLRADAAAAEQKRQAEEAKRAAEEAEANRIAEAKKRAAEEAAAAERQRAQDEIDRLNRERDQERRKAEELAEQAARQKAADEAEATRIAEEKQRAVDEAAAAARKLAQDKIDELQRERDAERQRADDERRRIEQIAEQAAREKAAEAAETKRRLEDQEHRNAIISAAKAAIMEHSGIKEGPARQIVLAIAAGSIPHTTIKF